MAKPLEQNRRIIKIVLLAAHSMTPRIEIENEKLNKARVFFLPIQSIKQNANRVPGNSAKVVQISST